jgi:glutamine amidotransferase
MIGIIDYGVGNINAFINILKQIGVPYKRVSNESELVNVQKLILPGVGHFDYAMKRFQDSGMIDKINKMVLQQNTPVLGVCVGMQMMANNSDEGILPGLGWINAEVKKFDSTQLIGNEPLPLPHMGWNDITLEKFSPILSGLENNSHFYFLHSFYFVCHVDSDRIATANYGSNFTCVANHKNVFGVQFHPEKSHNYGIKLLKNFSEIC